MLHLRRKLCKASSRRFICLLLQLVRAAVQFAHQLEAARQLAWQLRHAFHIIAQIRRHGTATRAAQPHTVPAPLLSLAPSPAKTAALGSQDCCLLVTA